MLSRPTWYLIDVSFVTPESQSNITPRLFLDLYLLWKQFYAELTNSRLFDAIDAAMEDSDCQRQFHTHAGIVWFVHNKHETLTQGWIDVGPASQKVEQYHSSIGSTSLLARHQSTVSKAEVIKPLHQTGSCGLGAWWKLREKQLNDTGLAPMIDAWYRHLKFLWKTKIR